MIKLPQDQPILVVDDNEVDLEILGCVLSDSRLTNDVLFFDCGVSVLAHLDEVVSGQHPMPALVLLDINMPHTTGFDVLDRLRSKPGLLERPIVAMLTSSDASEDIERAEKLGANSFLPKQSGFVDYVALIDRQFEN